jgi:3D (Asp-Asp-Asp) domain-containing protein/peptidoglycan hydrolase CwlO-like protein
VRGLARLQARILAVALCCALCGALGAASGAQTPKADRQSAGALRRANMTPALRIRGAMLDLYALDSELARTHARLVTLGARRERLRLERQSVRVRLDVSRRDLRVAQRRLELLVRDLYEQQANDPLAVVLGAQSLEDAITTLDDMSRAARENQQIAFRSLEAKQALGALIRRLAREDARVRALERAARQTAASLAACQASRREYVAALTAQRRLNDAQIESVGAQAQASAARSVAVTAQARTGAAPPPAPAPVIVSEAGTVTVVATGYSIRGSTATGLPTGWGTVAVDPSVIPLGTRLTIPGYGEGVAADTGPEIQGATIDLWFPTARQAQDWGRRVVTVTVH